MAKAFLTNAGVIAAMAMAGVTGTSGGARADSSPPVARSATLPNGMAVTQFTLANGLDLYVVENHAAPVFTFQTWFKVGSKDEKLDPRIHATGLAHLFEHMMFRGTAQHPDGDFDLILTRNGVTGENATTWLDRTNYYESLPGDRLELAMQLESDRMTGLRIDSNLLDTEKGAVLGELHMGLDDPATVASDLLYATAFTVHPYRYTTIGTEAEIRAFSADDANYFYRKYYSPGNATILVTGDVDPMRTAALAQQYYGAIPRQRVDRDDAPIEPAQQQERRAEFQHGQLTEGKIAIGYHTPEAKHPDQAPLQILHALLTLGQGSALQSAWVNAGITVDVGGGVDQFRDPGLFTLTADMQPGHDPQEALGALDHVLGALGGPGFSADVERARNQLLLSIYRQWEENEGLSGFMGEFIASAGDPLLAFSYVTAVLQATPDDVSRVASQYLVARNRTTVIGQPRGGR